MGHEPVAELTHEGIGGDAAEPIAATALQTYTESGNIDVLTTVLAHELPKLAQNLHACLDLIAIDLLGDQQTDALVVIVSEGFHERLGLVVLTPQSQYEYGTGIGVQTDVAQHTAGVLVVTAELGAAVVVVPRKDLRFKIGDLRFNFFAELLGKAFGDAVDTADGGYDPELVADTHITVLAAVATESDVLMGYGEGFAYWLVGVFEGARKVGLEVVLVHPLACTEVGDGMSDGVAILDDILTLAHIADEYLMACWGVLEQGDGSAVDQDGIASVQVLKTDDDAVGGMDLDER